MNPSLLSRQLVATRPTVGLRPVFGSGVGESIRRYQVLQAILRPHTLHALFAEPIIEGDQIRWYTTLKGEVVALSQLLPEQQERTKRILKYYADAAYELARHHRDADDLRRLLDDCFEIPDFDTVFLVGKRPVLVNWGFLKTDFNSVRGLVARLTKGMVTPRLMLNVKVISRTDRQPMADAAVVLHYEGQTRRLLTNEQGNVSFNDIFPFDFPVFDVEASADEFHSATTTISVDRDAADLILAGFTPLITTITLEPVAREQSFDIRVVDTNTNKPIDKATVRLMSGPFSADLLSGTSGWASFANVPLYGNEPVCINIAHADYMDEQSELDPAEVEHVVQLRPLELQGKRGMFSVNLRWKTTDDLDLLISDPGGNLISYSHRRVDYNGYVGILDIDANADDNNLTDQPQENIYWEQAHPGRYAIQVLLYKRRTATAEPIPFIITIVQGNERFEMNGQISQEKERQTVNIIDL
ncbi:hypothetical protein [Spirosoma fluviale]|uniref:DUF2135 domain-containing protein n=1 Tax=Spirosoma fluviale TaxID=1597977 RepID=A0A286GX18_9BACT|nr:hypothetical protein [Spirosoma fluviale]SOD99716.1 hypothetical protein SAMN06269250_0126 [Spirosoma fluviale]